MKVGTMASILRDVAEHHDMSREELITLLF